MEYPRIYLAVDNCFASKRWTEPLEWMTLMKEMDVNFVEASADNECDPLYMGSDYIHGWIEKVKEASEKTGVKIANLYSGHGTYATLGLAHTDVAIRDRFLYDWLKAMACTAAHLCAGMGFFCHAFPDSVLQDTSYFMQMKADLYNRLSIVAEIAKDCGCKSVGVEQMYTPHQIPWSIQGALQLLQEVNQRSKGSFYITIDVGHQSAQRKFLRPSFNDIEYLIGQHRGGKIPENIWMGPRSAWELFEKALIEPISSCEAIIKEIEVEMDKFPYLFASYEDGNPYSWLEQLGCYSPIVHLQQTSGKASSHWPFTEEFNQKGIIEGDKVLKAIKYAYDCGFYQEGLPEKCKDIYLTIEMFSATADMNHDILRKLKESVGYWRRYVPKDGLNLDSLLF